MKQKVNDSFSIFLQKAKKKNLGDDESIVSDENKSDAIKVLSKLSPGRTYSLVELAGNLDEPIFEVFDAIRQLESSHLVSVEKEAGTVTLTEQGEMLAGMMHNPMLSKLVNI